MSSIDVTIKISISQLTHIGHLCVRVQYKVKIMKNRAISNSCLCSKFAYVFATVCHDFKSILTEFVLVLIVNFENLNGYIGKVCKRIERQRDRAQYE